MPTDEAESELTSKFLASIEDPGRSTPLPRSNFGALWMGQGVSIVGSQFSALAIQMIAVTALQANPSQMGFLTASQTLPYLFLSLFIGVLVDRYSRKALLLWADGMRAAALVMAAALLDLGHMTVWALCAIVSFISLFTLIFDAALGAVIPELFEPGKRISVNSRLNMTLAGGDVVGHSMSGYALRIAGVTGTMLADAFTYLFSAACILWGVPQRRRAEGETMTHIHRIGIFRSVAEGVSFVATHRVLRILGVGSAIWNFSWSAVLAVLLIHCIRDLNLTTVEVGIAFAAGGVGGVAGSLFGWRLGRVLRRGPVLVFTPLVGIAGGLLLLLSFHGYRLWITAPALFLYNLGESSFGVNMQTTRQALTPLHLMGRMDTAMRFCFKGMASLGAIVGGLIATRFGTQTTVLLGVSGLIATFFVFIASSLRKCSDATTYCVADQSPTQSPFTI